ncbi:hypothetical protein DFH09DRAFT_1354943 [Mycena vulgaris]|nr:hypothetical protein DFH09DRAFT_1354943 [Mycena vulgaris]
MDPLKLSYLHAANDWNAFTPDATGYIPPQQLELHPDCAEIESQLREFTGADYMRDNNAPFLALSVAPGFPTTSLLIRGETFTLPLSSREMSFLATHLGDASSSRHTVGQDEVDFLNDTCCRAISARQTSVLRKLKVTNHRIATRTTFKTLDVLKAGSHELPTAPEDTNHFATIFVILPALSASGDICVHATHETATNAVQLPTDLTQSVSAIGVYAGVSGARIEVGAGGELLCITYRVCAIPDDRGVISLVPRLAHLSGALPPLRDAFCLWRHALNCGAPAPALLPFFLGGSPKSASEFTRYDATLLCHLAPLAKAYGFKMYVGVLVHTLSTEQEVYHPYKEYFGLNGDDLDPSDLRMSGDPEVDYEWTELRTLAGVSVGDLEPALVDQAVEMVETRAFQKQLMKVGINDDDEYEIEDDSCYYARVIYKHTREASVLFIAA